MGEEIQRSGIQEAMAKLRARALESEIGAFLGNEDALMSLLGASRGTVRQIARILEREGLLQVRRGVNGGYYAVRPDLGEIEAAVSGYLHSLDVKPDDATMIATVLWVETMRKAARAPEEQKQRLIDAFTLRLAELDAGASFDAVLNFEFDYRNAIFDLVGSRYVQLIFQINATFARDNYHERSNDTQSDIRSFVRGWRNAKLLELASMANGDPQHTAEAASRARLLWQERLSLQYRPV